MKMDKNQSGTIDKSEFMEIPGIVGNPLAGRVLEIFDEDGGGDIDFKEFLLGLSSFSNKGHKDEKLKCKLGAAANNVDMLTLVVTFKIYDMDRDGFISNGELFLVLKMMVGSNLKDAQLQQLVDKTIIKADKDGDGRISFEEFRAMVEDTDVVKQMALNGL